MSVFSTNQTNQLYVAKSLDTTIDSNSAVGAINAKGNANDLYFEYMSPDGIVRSDLIPKDKIISARAKSYLAMQRGLAKYEVTLDSTVNSGAPVSGQDYLLRITFFEWGSPSPENQFYKYGVVRATTGMSASTFYANMLESLVNNFKREAVPLLSFSATGGTSVWTYTNGVWYDDGVASTKASAIADTLTKITISEIEQPWRLGIKASDPLVFKILSDQILSGGAYANWGVVTKVASSTTIGNGKITADREYFLLGERGDIYRYTGFPNNFVATYLADATKEYCYIDIVYYYKGSSEAIQESQKVITLVVPAEGVTPFALTQSIIGDINTAYGSTLIALTDLS